jgi:hypothetical protein
MPDEVFAVRFQRFAQKFGIGQDEVRRRQGVGDLFDIEVRLVPRVLVEIGGLHHQLLRPLRGDQVDLLDEVEELVLVPFRVAEPLVARVGGDGRRRRLAHHPFQRRVPQVDVFRPQAPLRLHGALGVRHPVFADLSERLEDDGQLVRHLGLDLTLLARFDIGRHGLAGVLHDAGEVLGKGFRIVDDILEKGVLLVVRHPGCALRMIGFRGGLCGPLPDNDLVALPLAGIIATCDAWLTSWTKRLQCRRRRSGCKLAACGFIRTEPVCRECA